MNPAAGLGHVWVIGPGRIGRALGSKLSECSIATSITYIGRALDPRAAAPTKPDRLPTPISAYSWGSLPPDPPAVILITVRDGEVAEVARALAALDLPPGVALHTSGVLSSAALNPLAEAGWATGSVAPVVSVSDPIADAELLLGAWYAVEGSPRALAAAERMVNSLEGRLLHLRSSEKVAYHTAAVFASNFLNGVMAAAEGLMEQAGVERAEARSVLSLLAQGTLANIRDRGPQAALSGPIGRGDFETIALHLDRLSEMDRRLYSVLALRTLAIAREQGLDPATADRIQALLEASG